MLARTYLAAALLLASVAVHAQGAAQTDRDAGTSTAARLTPEQQKLLQGQNRQMIRAAKLVTQMIDQDRAGEIWEGASVVAKARVGKTTFVRQVSADRKAAGAVESRDLRGITRSRSKGGTIPAGVYINVAFATRFANYRGPVRELVSFHLDPDKRWRVAGYTLH